MHDFDNLQGFLEHVALATSIDQDWDGEKVNLMTIHAAKGLEFDIVILPEGYSKNEMGLFIDDCREFANGLFNYYPYSINKNKFNSQSSKSSKYC